MKLYERPKTEQELDRLPELPEGVEVPDNISGLHLPRALKPAAGAVRWMRWLAVIVALSVAGVLAAVLITSGDDDPIENTQAGYDRHLVTMADLAAERVAPDSMALYGTDNPVFVTPSVPVLGSDRHLATVADQIATDFMAIYGTDNPVFVPSVPEETTAIPTEGPGSNSLAP